MASSKSSQTTRNIVIACLALWSVISLIIIVVWATSPDMRSASQCRAELQTLNEKLEGAKVVWAKDRQALEDHIMLSRENQTQLQQQIDALTGTLRETNMSLADCQETNTVLNTTVKALENETEMYKQIKANLTSVILLQKDHIECLELNLTQISHQWESCEALRNAAESQQRAAESQNKACNSNKQYLQKQLQRCKMDGDSASQDANRSHGLQTSALVLCLSFCILKLIFSCELNDY